MLLSADSLTIIFVKIYCYWTRTVGVISKGSRGPVFFWYTVYMSSNSPDRARAKSSRLYQGL